MSAHATLIRTRSMHSLLCLTVTVLILLVCAGCKKQQEKPFRLGAEIPMGEFTMRVSSVEAVANGPEHNLIVYLRTQNFTQEDTGAFMVKCLRTMRLREGSGRRYRPTIVKPAELYRTERAYLNRDYEGMLESSDRAAKGLTNEWVAIFTAPLETHDFTLLVEMPESRWEGSQIAAVPLGR